MEDYTKLNKTLVKNILSFYKDKEIFNNYKYIQFNIEYEYEIDVLNDFKELCNKNIFILQSSLNKHHLNIIFTLFKNLYNDYTTFETNYTDNIDKLIYLILKKENNSDYHCDNIKDKYGINIYDYKYINEWIESINLYEVDIIKHDSIPKVITYKKCPLINDAMIASQRIFTIQDIIDEFM